MLSILSSEIEWDDREDDSKKKADRSNHYRKKTSAAPDGSVIYATYARIVSSCPSNPDTIRASIPPIIRAILKDIQLIYGASLGRAEDSQKQDSSKKSKSKLKSKKNAGDRFQDDWNQDSDFVPANPLDLQHVQRGLDALTTLLGAAPYFLGSSNLTKALRVLLKLATHPAFVCPTDKSYLNKPNSAILVSKSAGALNHSGENLSINLAFVRRPDLRPMVLKCLLGCLPIARVESGPAFVGLNLAQTLLETCTQIIIHSSRNALGEGNTGFVELARLATAMITQFIARPKLPVAFLTETQVHARQEGEDSSVSGSETVEDEAEERQDMDRSEGEGRPVPRQDPMAKPTNDRPQEPAKAVVRPSPLVPMASPSTDDAPARPTHPAALWASSLTARAQCDARKRKSSPSQLVPLPKKLNGHRPVAGVLSDEDEDEDDQLPSIHFDFQDDDDDEEDDDQRDQDGQT